MSTLAFLESTVVMDTFTWLEDGGDAADGLSAALLAAEWHRDGAARLLQLLSRSTVTSGFRDYPREAYPDQ